MYGCLHGQLEMDQKENSFHTSQEMGLKTFGHFGMLDWKSKAQVTLRMPPQFFNMSLQREGDEEENSN